ncbi:unnamed protein product [Mesocestoides corti]|uniref:histone acetyltransferase n=1 Tax=Mesocestoides corti TaxID=53468 RepID=A0A3P6GX66_MESCO|nr:unnamed protein product [Mesocestoides corti]
MAGSHLPMPLSARDALNVLLIQQQFLPLLQADFCRQEQEHSAPCTNRRCRTMRNVLRHIHTCTEGMNCRGPHCASSRRILSHWKNCASRECPVCESIRRVHSSAHHLGRLIQMLVNYLWRMR